MSDIDFSQVKGLRIPSSEVKYIVGHDQAIHEGNGKALLWRRPNEFPYVIGAYTTPDGTEYFSSHYVEKYQEPVAVKAAYLPTYNPNLRMSDYLVASQSLVGTLLNGYYCNNEADCQNLHIPSNRRKISNVATMYWASLDTYSKKILVYASKGQNQMLVATPYPQHIEGVPTFLRYSYTPPLSLGAGFPMPYGEVNTPELCRVLDATTPIITIRLSNGGTYRAGYYFDTNKITAVREDFSDYVAKYDEITSGAYSKSEYPYLDGVTELGINRVNVIPNTYNLGYVFAFYVFFRVAR